MANSDDKQEEDKQEQEQEGARQEQERTEFGRALRSFRGVSLRKLEKSRHNQGKDGVSRSTLSRYESGKTLPKLCQAKHLDTLYGADGKIELYLTKLWHHIWTPGLHTHEAPKRNYFYRWPPKYSGTIWIRIKPTPDSVDEYHKICLYWGPWKVIAELELPADGIYLTTGKAADVGNLSITLKFDCDLHVFALFGAGDIEDETAHKLDISQKWTWR